MPGSGLGRSRPPVAWGAVVMRSVAPASGASECTRTAVRAVSPIGTTATLVEGTLTLTAPGTSTVNAFVEQHTSPAGMNETRISQRPEMSGVNETARESVAPGAVDARKLDSSSPCTS